ncbi:uncharacterized protein BKA55DRAFT_563025 [Fusarium redolens]|uniref:Uncharacterized protein n=1 Tax=Fusarium redolens TaxID=48865 RepID=A0A9P9HLR4_FUSRE|nr:uncharacterized protein BKA55DRAFT_563025 [Fusarium redolens]KAH7259681.1 hypothetical protein BKA55DRAFT_563025 [Fusarium redolens]
MVHNLHTMEQQLTTQLSLIRSMDPFQMLSILCHSHEDKMFLSVPIQVKHLTLR